MREANKKSKKKVPTKLVIAIMEAKNHKEAQRIIKSLSKAKGGGKQKQEGVEDGPDDPVIMKSKGGDDGDSSDDEDITIHLASHNMYVSCTVISGYVM